MKYILFIIGFTLALAALTFTLLVWCTGVRFDKNCEPGMDS